MRLLLLLLAATARAVEIVPVEARLAAPPALIAPALSASLAAPASLPTSASLSPVLAVPAAAVSIAAFSPLAPDPSAPAAAAPAAIAAPVALSAPAADDAPLRRDGAHAGRDRIAETIARWSGAGDGRDASAEFDGARERDEAFAYVEHGAREEPAVAHMHQERETLDYHRSGYDEDDARAFAAEPVEIAEGTTRSGRELLQLLVTREASRIDASPDLTILDPETLGRSDAQLRALAESGGAPYHALTAFYHQAFLRGLVYRLHDSARRRAYYGVPHFVRAALGLADAAEAAAPAPERAAAPSAFAAALPELARAAEELPAKDELFEFAAQVVDAAVRGGVLARAAVPASFQERADAIDFEAAPLKDTVLTLLESAHGTPWQARALALAEAAAAEGRLPRAELDAVLNDLR